MPNPRYRVLGQAETTLFLRNQPTLGFRVTFVVGEAGPFSVEVPSAEYTPERVRKLIEEKVEAIEAVADL